MNNQSNKISLQLRKLLDAMGWTETEASEKLGVSQANINRILNDPSVNPRQDTLAKIAKGFNISVSELVTGTRPVDLDTIPAEHSDILQQLEKSALTESDYTLLKTLIIHLDQKNK